MWCMGCFSSTSSYQLEARQAAGCGSVWWSVCVLRWRCRDRTRCQTSPVGQPQRWDIQSKFTLNWYGKEMPRVKGIVINLWRYPNVCVCWVLRRLLVILYMLQHHRNGPLFSTMYVMSVQINVYIDMLQLFIKCLLFGLPYNNSVQNSFCYRRFELWRMSCSCYGTFSTSGLFSTLVVSRTVKSYQYSSNLCQG